MQMFPHTYANGVQLIKIHYHSYDITPPLLFKLQEDAVVITYLCELTLAINK